MQNTTQTKPPAPPPAVPPPEFRADRFLQLDEAALLAVVKDPKAPVFDKNVACRRLAIVGTKAAVPALAALLGDAQLAAYARFALGPIPDAAVDDALRASLPKLKGALLVGVLNTIGQRRDARAVETVAKLVYSPEKDVSEAAASAIGSIGGAAAAKVLREALGKIKGSVRAAIADAGLVCAEGMLAQGDREGALAMYDLLSRRDIPKPVRTAALHSAFAVETSFARPRETVSR